jgi:hypothetical protein
MLSGERPHIAKACWQAGNPSLNRSGSHCHNAETGKAGIDSTAQVEI